MIRRLLICTTLVFITISSVAQNSKQHPRSFNSIYDSLTISNISISEYSGSLPAPDSLVYDPGGNYYSEDLKRILDGARYTHSEKINFIKAAITDTIKDLFSHIQNEPIEFWHKNNQAQLLMLNYFMKLNGAQRNVSNIDSRYFNFVISNALPGTTEMVEAYIQNRSSLKRTFTKEVNLIYQLIQAGSEKNALNLLQLLANEYTGDHWIEDSWGDRNDDSHVFDLLCFSNNNFIREEARQLLWTCLDKEIDSELLDIGLYLNEKKAIQCLQKRFQYYTTVVLEKIDSAVLNKANRVPKQPPVVSSYFRFMRWYYWQLAKTMSKQVWAECMNRMPFWDHYYGSQRFLFQTRILNEVFKDSSLTERERRQMLYDLKFTSFNRADFNNRYTIDHGLSHTYDAMIQLYLKLINQAYPNGDISADDSTRLYLREINTSYKPERERPEHYVNMDAAVSDLKQLDLAHFQLQPNQPDYWAFKWTLYNSDLIPLLEKSGLVSSFHTSGYTTAKEIFSLYVEPLLAKKGITDIDVQIETDKIPNKYSHKIFVRSKEGTYLKEYSKAEYDDRARVYTLANMINLLLMKKNIKERLVKIDDSGSDTYGLFEPEKLKLFLDKYSMNSYELNKAARLMK